MSALHSEGWFINWLKSLINLYLVSCNSVQFGDVSVVRVVLSSEDFKLMLQTEDSDENTPLLIACQRKDSDVIREFLLESPELADKPNK